MDTEQTQVNLLVVQAFEALRIPYFLGGSMASSVHGIYRATAGGVAKGRKGAKTPRLQCRLCPRFRTNPLRVWFSLFEFQGGLDRDCR